MTIKWGQLAGFEHARGNPQLLSEWETNKIKEKRINTRPI